MAIIRNCHPTHQAIPWRWDHCRIAKCSHCCWRLLS